jgi:hypothetical protein
VTPRWQSSASRRGASRRRVVSRLLRPDRLPQFGPIFDRMPAGQFRIISAAKATRLLHSKLFDRVHALSLKGFTRKFRNAEVDMHLSLRNSRRSGPSSSCWPREARRSSPCDSTSAITKILPHGLRLFVRARNSWHTPLPEVMCGATLRALRRDSRRRGGRERSG